jgi:RsiW-degrading membrane proteinase PrsW (M82 family)
MVLKIFLWGALITLPVFFVQIGFSFLLTKLNLSPIFISLLYWFIVISLTEEVFKYLVVRVKVLSHYEFDEPLDVMLYMIIVALGFAALENILYLFSPTGLSFNEVLSRTLVVSFIRFLGATFLHTLCSGIFGYFLALSFYETKKRLKLLVLGILAATSLHGLYDFSIMTITGPMQIIIPVMILTALASFVISGFEKVKKIKSVCKIT